MIDLFYIVRVLSAFVDLGILFLMFALIRAVYELCRAINKLNDTIQEKRK